MAKNITQISAPFVAIPPKSYGGTERVIADLIAEYPERFVLLAPGNSEVSCELKATVDKAFFDDPKYDHDKDRARKSNEVNTTIPELLPQKSSLIHLHDYENPDLVKRLLDESGQPILITIHHAIKEDICEFVDLFRFNNRVHFNAVSRDHAESFAGIYPNMPFISHGLNPARFEYQQNKGNYFLSVGDMKPIKGHKTAIELAKRLRLDLIIGGEPIYPESKKYFNSEIKPDIDIDLSESKSDRRQLLEQIARNRKTDKQGTIIYFGAVNDAEKRILMANARFLNFLGGLETGKKHYEAFGLVALEGLLSGTPVITTGNNPISDLVTDPEVGAIVSDLSEASSAARSLDGIPRNRYSWIQRNFGSRAMFNRYTNLYRKVVS